MAMRFFFLTLICAGTIHASDHNHERLNPEISLFGDFRGTFHTDDSRENSRRYMFDRPSLEIDFTGELNEYSNAFVAIGWHEDERAELEEAFLTVHKGLPLSMRFSAGRYLLPFGYINTLHPHDWSFLRRPLAHKYLFGEEGLRDVAFGITVAPLSSSGGLEITGALTSGTALDSHDDAPEADPDADHEEINRTGVFGRIESRFSLRENGTLTLGMSGLHSVSHAIPEEALAGLLANDPDSPQWSSLFGIDLRYQKEMSNSRKIRVVVEGILRRENSLVERNNSYGLFLALDYQLSATQSAGVIMESLQQTIPTLSGTQLRLPERETSRMGLFVGFNPAEETMLSRFAAHWTKESGSEGYLELTLQFLFQLGHFHEGHD